MMLKLRPDQIERGQRPSDAAAISKLAEGIAADVAQTAPDIPAVLTRLNVRLLLASLQRQGIEELAVQAPVVTRYFAAGQCFAREPYSSRWRHVLIAREMTPEAKLAQLEHLLKQAEAALAAE
jgi:hypothetical protein